MACAIRRSGQAWRRLLLGHLPPAPAAVADIGCGTGSLSVLLAEAGYTVTGLDSAPAMIGAARAKAAAARVSARFVTSDAASPALPAGSFNVVLSRHVLWAMPNVDDALAAWVRLLQPGGTLLLIEGRWHTGAGAAAAAGAGGGAAAAPVGFRYPARRSGAVGRAGGG